MRQETNTTEDRIAPILFDTYGENNTTRALAADLAGRIDGYEFEENHRTRHDMIMLTCWNWFSGGGTAESVAERIEAALGEPARPCETYHHEFGHN